VGWVKGNKAELNSESKGGCHEVPSLPGIDGYGKILRSGNALLGIQVSLLRGDPRSPYFGKSK
jgi:hypothetical protein